MDAAMQQMPLWDRCYYATDAAVTSAHLRQELIIITRIRQNDAIRSHNAEPLTPFVQADDDGRVYDQSGIVFATHAAQLGLERQPLRVLVEIYDHVPQADPAPLPRELLTWAFRRHTS